MVSISDAAVALAAIDNELRKLEAELAEAQARVQRAIQHEHSVLKTIETLRTVGLAILGEQR